MSIVKRIFELQQIDAALLSTHKQLDDIRKQIEHNDIFERARETFESTRQGLTDLEKQYKELDAEAEELRKGIKGIEDKLYGGKIKNPKELVGYEQEAGGLRARLSKMDDSLLEMMERIESGKVNVGKLKKAFDEAEAAWASEKRVLLQKADEMKTELAGLETKRQEILSDIDGGSLSLYEGIRGRRAQAVARVEQGRCMGCRCFLSVSELQRVRGSSIVQCSNCGRILYLS
jgi:predicted  nucleic acid-binding Zn-ribbon protein